MRRFQCAETTFIAKDTSSVSEHDPQGVAEARTAILFVLGTLSNGDMARVVQVLQFVAILRSQSMDSISQMQQPFSTDVPAELSDTRSLHTTPTVVDIARSDSNVLQWMSYLPEDCINTMIAMGWDVTT